MLENRKRSSSERSHQITLQLLYKFPRRYFFSLLSTKSMKLTRNDRDDEGELGSRIKTNLRTSTQQQRSQVQGTTRSIGRDKLEVVGDGTFTGLDEECFGDGSHTSEFCRVDHALCVCVGAEDADLTVLASECLDSFEALLLEGGMVGGV